MAGSISKAEVLPVIKLRWKRQLGSSSRVGCMFDMAKLEAQFEQRREQGTDAPEVTPPAYNMRAGEQR